MAQLGSSLASLRTGMSRNLVLDAGKLYVNVNITDMLSATTGAGIAFSEAVRSDNTWVDANGTTVAPVELGGTRGGTTFSLKKEERQVEVDGRRTNIKGLQRVDMISPSIKTGLLEMADMITLRRALGTSILTDYANFETARPSLYPLDEDYFGNICLFATIAQRVAPNGEPLPICIVLENCRADVLNDIAFKDKSEATLELELTAHALDSDAFTIPCLFIVPKAISTYY
jgi:hypothetical protein